MQREGKKQMLIIEPKNEIAFKGPYDHVVTEYFTLKNPTEATIAFKVKTTAPKRYCVRPNNGQVSPHQTVQVAVMLQPGDLTQEKHKHKFMIQSVTVPSNNNQSNANVDELFKSASPDEIMDSKFKCVFLDGLFSTGSTGTGFVASAAPPSLNSSVSNMNSSTAQNFDKLDDGSDENNIGLANGAGEYSSPSTYGGTGENGNHHIDDQTTNIMNSNDHHYDSEDNYNKQAASSNLKNEMNKLKPGTLLLSNSKNDFVASSNIHHDTNQNDAESKLKMAQEEIRLLKDKLHEVQRYASKFVNSPDKKSSSSSSSTTSSTTNAVLSNNDHQLLPMAAIVGLVAFLVGIFFAKVLI